MSFDENEFRKIFYHFVHKFCFVKKALPFGESGGKGKRFFYDRKIILKENIISSANNLINECLNERYALKKCCSTFASDYFLRD